MKPINRLGRGLDALIDTTNVTQTDGGSMINEIDLNFIVPNPNQPRKHFDKEELEELAVSIRENGIISPITLRQIDEENYQIIAGERRFRAAKLAGLTKIPAYIRQANDEQMQVMALIENIQRTDLNAIEMALGYSKIISDFGFTQEQLGEKLGKKRATITNYLRLLNLPAKVQIGIKDKKIDMGHARALAGLESEIEQLEIYELVVSQGLSVRKTEELVKWHFKIIIGIRDKKIEMEHAIALAKLESEFEQLEFYEFIVTQGLSVRKTEELVNLPEKIRISLQNKKIDIGHAIALTELKSEDEQLRIFELIINQKLSVKKTEELVKNPQEENTENLPKQREKKVISEELLQYKDEIKNIFNTNISISSEDSGKGKITISFADDEELSRIMSIFDALNEKVS